MDYPWIIGRISTQGSICIFFELPWQGPFSSYCNIFLISSFGVLAWAQHAGALRWAAAVSLQFFPNKVVGNSWGPSCLVACCGWSQSLPCVGTYYGCLHLRHRAVVGCASSAILHLQQCRVLAFLQFTHPPPFVALPLFCFR
jgi:hypothetical protein